MRRYIWLPCGGGSKIRIWPIREPSWIETLFNLRQRAQPGQEYKVVIVEGLGAVTTQKYTDVLQANEVFAEWAQRTYRDRLFGVGLIVRDANGTLSTLLVHPSKDHQEWEWFMAAFWRQVLGQGERTG